MDKNLKLNYKRTMIIGFAFFSILMVWQAYNAYCPLFLKTLLYRVLVEKNATQYTEFIVGAIMALDNVLALFMLPIFGKLSDKTKTKYGKRMPYIILGMVATIIAFPFMALCYIWNSLAGLIVTMLVVLVIMNIYRSPAVALMPDVTPKPLRSTANGLINLVGYFGPILISLVNMIFKFSQGETGFTKVFVPVIVVVLSLIIAIVVLIIKINEPKILEEVKDELVLGEEMSTTQEKVVENKPLSKADKKNMIVLLVAVCLWFMCFNAFETFNSMYCDEYYTEYTLVETLTEFKAENTYCIKDGEKYYIVGNFSNYNVYYTKDGNGNYTLVKELIAFEDGVDYYLLLGEKYVIANKVDSSIDYYIKDAGTGISSLGVIIVTVSSVITFAVAGYFAVKFGRKPNVLVGIGLLALGCLIIYLLGTERRPGIEIYLCFVILGIGWALINVNSYPMMVEMSTSSEIGKYTGLYYTASMIAQSITPILFGGIIAFVPGVSLKYLFLYSTIMAVLALLVLFFFKENKDRVKEIKTGLSALDQD